MTLGLALPCTASSNRLASRLRSVAWTADGPSVSWVQFRAAGRDVVNMINLIGVTDAVRPALLTLMFIALKHFDPQLAPSACHGHATAGRASSPCLRVVRAVDATPDEVGAVAVVAWAAT